MEGSPSCRSTVLVRWPCWRLRAPLISTLTDISGWVCLSACIHHHHHHHHHNGNKNINNSRIYPTQLYPTDYIIRSTPKSRPNNLYMGLRMSIRPYVRPYVNPSTKSFSDSDEIWYVGRGRWVMHDGMPYDPIQGQGHETFKVRNSSISNIYLLRHF